MESQEQTTPRKPYHEPKLVVYGDVIEITRGGVSSSNSDHGNNSMSPH